VDEKILESARREPRPEFASDLRGRLAGMGPAPRARTVPLGLTLAVGTLTAAAVALIAVPSVRVSAEAFLDLFRVRTFTAVSFDPTRFDKLRSLGSNHELMVFDRAGGPVEPPAPVVYPTPEAAGAAAGLSLRQPAYLPGGFALDTVLVEPEESAQLTVNEPKLRALLDALELQDVAIPAGLAGRTVTVRRPPVVIEHYRRGRAEIHWVQAKSPEVALPAGVDLEQLGQIGLRVLGLDAGEARRVAASIDWHSTLVVPVPITASSFRQVTVNGNPGLLVSYRGDAGGPRERQRDGTLILWTEGERVQGLMSGLGGPELIQVAESMR
jgi:hypothetical protein